VCNAVYPRRETFSGAEALNVFVCTEENFLDSIFAIFVGVEEAVCISEHLLLVPIDENAKSIALALLHAVGNLFVSLGLVHG
jgi:hypothetical protein